MNRFNLYRLRLVFFAAVALFCFAALLQTAGAQETAPTGDVANGVVIFQQRCANCHGITGLGDGQIAAQAISPPTPLGDPEYQRSANPATMFETISIGRMQRGMPLFGEGSSNPLSEQERWDVIAAIYALGTNSAELSASGQAVGTLFSEQFSTTDWANSSNRMVFDALGDNGLSEEERWAAVNWGRMTFGANYYLGAGSIAGSVLNVSTSEPLASGPVTLVAFEELEPVQSWEATVDATGAFRFEIPNVPSDWIFRVTTTHDSLPYSSDFIQLRAGEMAQSQTVLVYDRTNSADLIALQELRVVAEVGAEQVFFNEFYAYRNDGTSVYAGGTQLFVPDSAENLRFIGITPNGEFFPINNINPAGDGYFYAEAITPGAGMELLVRYSLPYEGGATIEHPVALQPETTTLFVPEELNVAGEWQMVATELIQGESFTRYNNDIDQTLSVAIGGNTRFAVDGIGNRVVVRDEQQELLIGGVALAITIAACAYLLNLWQQQTPNDPAPLLHEVAALDNAYAAKQIKKKAYEKRRNQLLQQIRDVWASN
ncbi:MAG: c-type cytochrome [Candidatus Promineifilaceae bacterium]